MEKLNVTPGLGVSELIVRQGKAIEPPKPNKSIAITGTLGAPFQFLSGKKELNGDIDIHLKIYKDQGKLELVMGDQNPDTTHTITGTLTPSNDLKEFGINTLNQWSIRDFLFLVKKMRYFFPDKNSSL